jgi:hypothetical protein
VVNASGIYTFNTPFYAVSEYSGTSNYQYIDGNSNVPVASTGNFGISAYGIGRDVGTATGYWNGYIGEVLVYASYLNDYDRFRLQTYLSNKWSIILPTVTNATPNTDYTITSDGVYTYYNFLTPGKTMYLTTSSVQTIQYILVGGGGGGGFDCGGGGGAGGLLTSSSYSLAAGSYNITIGSGGAGGTSTDINAPSGNNTLFSSFTAFGGGGGGKYARGARGGCGGGGGWNNSAQAGGSGAQGSSGGSSGPQYTGGGGGGVTGTGITPTTTTAGNGGAGTTWNNGTAIQLGGGGAGGGTVGGTGSFGGGNGGTSSTTNATSGTLNTGGGGGGGRFSGVGGNGGSGFVSIGFLTSRPPTFPTFLPLSGSQSGFLTKYSSTTGAFTWATRQATTSSVASLGSYTDSSGNVYITGYYSSSPLTIYNADGSTFGTTIPNQGSYDVYVVKYNTSGVAQWGAHVGGGGDDQGNGIAVDSSGNVYISGFHTSSPLTIYNADGSTFGTIPYQGGPDDAFVVKYNTSGVAQWGAHVGGTGDDTGQAIAVDSSGNVYITGYYTSPITIYNADGSTFGTTITNQGGSTDCYVVKYNTSGVAQWGAHVGGTGDDSGLGIAVDSSGKVYIAGYYTSNPLRIYNANGSTFGTITNQEGSYDVSVVKYNTSGVAQWGAHIGGAGTAFGLGIAVDSSGNVYITGYYSSSPLTIYSANGSTFGSIPNQGGAYDAFVVKYNTSGVAQWGTHIGGTGADFGRSIAVDSLGNVYITGYYTSNPVIFYDAPPTATIT